MSKKRSGGPRKNESRGKGPAQGAATVTPINERGSIRQKKEDSGRQATELGIEEQIRVRAYQFFEERGRQEGFDQEDWARAEAEIRAKLRQGKSA